MFIHHGVTAVLLESVTHVWSNSIEVGRDLFEFGGLGKKEKGQICLSRWDGMDTWYVRRARSDG